jgi:hypothetical protein
MTSRSRGSVLSLAAAISLAASRSSRNFGSGSGFPRDHGVARRGVRPVPFNEPLEELADGPHPLPVRLRRDQPACAPGPGSQPHLEVLDVIAPEVTDSPLPGLGDHPPCEVTQRVVCCVDARRGKERA